MLDQVKTEAARTNLAPIPMECDAPHLKVTGELPRELNGTLYRNGPNPQFDAPGAHWFVGDGMLHAFHLENGRASYRNRWIRTPKWLAEHDAGRALFGGFGRKLPGTPAGITDDGGVANTNIIFHGGKLLALEEGHLPTEIEPGTLNRLGYCDYKGAIKGPFTAHPKIDPVTGEMVFLRGSIASTRPMPAWCTTSSSPKIICCFRSCPSPAAWSARCAASRLTPGSRRKARMSAL